MNYRSHTIPRLPLLSRKSCRGISRNREILTVAVSGALIVLA